MLQATLLSLSALLALVPAAVLSFRPEADRRPGMFWTLLGVATAGALIWSLVQLGGAWRTGLAATLWVSIAATLVLYGAIAAVSRSAWRLAPLLLPYLVLLGCLATLTGQHQRATQGAGLAAQASPVWIDLHIAISVGTYALVTIAAVAGLAALLQERALKAKRPTQLTRQLPAMADAETLQYRLLAASALVLAAGIATGSAVLYFKQGRFLVIDHKTLFSLASFFTVLILLAAQRLAGVRGRAAGRLMLVAYLLLTLGYPGVKFVTGILMG
ncbi:MAG TPA: cytochrome c biogenesis protein CcsA [Azospirillaceae bacterium]|nr:cytochrome c biogenesis protein CcsA [Azospirillaceae bacterium]